MLTGNLKGSGTLALSPHSHAIVGLVAALAGYLGGTGTVTAQTTTSGQTIGKMEVELTGTITSSVVLTVEGSTNENGGASTAVTGTGNRGTVSFGNFRRGGPGTGESYHVDGAVKGTYLVATIRLKTQFSGSGGPLAVLDIQRSSPCG